MTKTATKSNARFRSPRPPVSRYRRTTTADFRWTIAAVNLLGDIGPYVVVHPGATVPARAWAPQANADLVRMLASNGVRVVVTGGADERDLCAFVAGDHAANLAGKTDFRMLARVIADAQAIVVGNTSAAHVAAAVGTKVVSIFAPTIPASRFRPWSVEHVLLGDQEIGCRGCRCPRLPARGPRVRCVRFDRRDRQRALFAAGCERVSQPKRILLWHVHGSYTTALVQGTHTYYLPVLPDRSEDGRGRARTWDWPANAIEITEAEAREYEFDAVIMQRPSELDGLVEGWTGKTPGRGLPAIYLEHNAPEGRVAGMRHPAADRHDITIVHVTHFNDVFWDCGTTQTRVIEHGVIDPGYRYTGELNRAAVAINEARRRGRVTGTDLLPRFASVMPIDLFGMDAAALGGFDDPPQSVLHAELPRRRAYVHPMRWTSLGLSLIEAMMLGMPVVALATTEAIEAVPARCGIVSTNVERLCAALTAYGNEPERAREDGRRARAYARERYGLGRFLSDWDDVLAEVTA